MATLANRMGGLPLALVQAGSDVETTEEQLSDAFDDVSARITTCCFLAANTYRFSNALVKLMSDLSDKADDLDELDQGSAIPTALKNLRPTYTVSFASIPRRLMPQD